MSVQQRNIIKLSGIIQMNSKTSLYISGIFILPCIFLVTVENLLLTVGLKRLYNRQELYQCSVGGIKPILPGKSYNMCWRIHEVVAEAVSRLFKEQYVALFISEKLVEQSKSDDTTLKNSKEFEEYYAKYVEMQKRCNAGEFGVTAKYWMLYVRITDLIHQLHQR